MAVALLCLITLLYAGYNLFIKVSGGHVPESATTTLLATVCVQVFALLASSMFFVFLSVQGGHSFRLSQPVYLYAAVAGLCIGAAEIGYFYLFGGVGAIKPMAANVAIPAIVTGTIVITMIVAHFLLRETLTLWQVGGAVLVAGGIVMLFLGGRAGPVDVV
jgi:drug/metabolite transporter (DMT)-like permease